MSSMAVVGALTGTAFCVIGGWVGARAIVKAAVSDVQRDAVREILAYGASYAALVMAIILLTAFQVLPQWGFVAAAALWFGPLIPALSWAHQRLDMSSARPALSAA
jgi:hypothetical protein